MDCIHPTIAMAALAAACAGPSAVAGPSTAASLQKVAILKADDLYPVDWRPDGLSTGWARFFDHAEQGGYDVTAGVIWGRTSNAAWDSVLVGLAQKPNVELWHHGWDHALNIDGDPTHHEFKGSDFIAQATHLWAGLNRARALGIPCTTFGAPGNAIDTTTRQAMDATDGVSVWFFGDPAWTGGLVLPRANEVILEPTTGAPSLATFQTSLAAHASLPVIVVQVHPASYTVEKQDVLDQAVVQLQRQGWTLMTARDYELMRRLP